MMAPTSAAITTPVHVFHDIDASAQVYRLPGLSIGLTAQAGE